MISFIADGLIFIIVISGGLALLIWTPKPRIVAYSYGAMAGITALLFAKLMSLTYQPLGGRPFEKTGASAGAAYIDNPGFPSDHALFATVITMAVVGLTGKRWLGTVLGILVIVMCVGRVLALVHTPIDIAGGIGAGLLGSLWYLVPQSTKNKNVAKKAK